MYNIIFLMAQRGVLHGTSKGNVNTLFSKEIEMDTSDIELQIETNAKVSKTRTKTREPVVESITKKPGKRFPKVVDKTSIEFFRDEIADHLSNRLIFSRPVVSKRNNKSRGTTLKKFLKYVMSLFVWLKTNVTVTSVLRWLSRNNIYVVSVLLYIISGITPYLVTVFHHHASKNYVLSNSGKTLVVAVQIDTYITNKMVDHITKNCDGLLKVEINNIFSLAELHFNSSYDSQLCKENIEYQMYEKSPIHSKIEHLYLWNKPLKPTFFESYSPSFPKPNTTALSTNLSSIQIRMKVLKNYTCNPLEIYSNYTLNSCLELSKRSIESIAPYRQFYTHNHDGCRLCSMENQRQGGEYTVFYTYATNATNATNVNNYYRSTCVPSEFGLVCGYQSLTLNNQFGVVINSTNGQAVSNNMFFKRCDWCNDTMLTMNQYHMFRILSNYSECCAYGILKMNKTSFEWWYTDDIVQNEHEFSMILNNTHPLWIA